VRAAVAFLTRIPVGAEGRVGGPGAAWFGVVGIGLGVLGAIPLVVLGPYLGWSAAVLALAAVAILSGALHLDGLADTADALAVRDPERADLARRDPRTGAAGVVAVVLVLLLDVTALGIQAGTEWGGFLFVGAIAASRAVLPIAAILAGRSARSARSGLGEWFASNVSIPAAVVSAGTAVIPGLVALVAFGWRSPLVGTLAALIGGVVAAAVISRLRGGLDGDGYGAVAELTTPIALMASTAAWP
jgi:adenosylcobinamide-GDP ribazoletransferase